MEAFYDTILALVRANDVAALRELLTQSWARSYAYDIGAEIMNTLWLLTAGPRDEMYELVKPFMRDGIMRPMLLWHPETGSRLDDPWVTKHNKPRYSQALEPTWSTEDAPLDAVAEGASAFHYSDRVRIKPDYPRVDMSECENRRRSMFNDGDSVFGMLESHDLWRAAEHTKAEDRPNLLDNLIYFEERWDLTGPIDPDLSYMLPFHRLGLSDAELTNMASYYRDNNVTYFGKWWTGPMSVFESFELTRAARADVWHRLDMYKRLGVYDWYRLRYVLQHVSRPIHEHVLSWMCRQECNTLVSDTYFPGYCYKNRTARLWAFWTALMRGEIHLGAVWFFAIVLVCDDYFRIAHIIHSPCLARVVRSNHSARIAHSACDTRIVRFIHIATRLPIELQALVSGWRQTGAPLRDDCTLKWLLQLLTDDYFALNE